MFEGLKDMGKMMKQAQQMKKQMKRVQDALAKETVEGSALNGQIVVIMTGEMNVVDVKIDAELLDDSQKSRLEKGMKEAINDATLKSKKIATERLTAVTGGLNLPGM